MQTAASQTNEAPPVEAVADAFAAALQLASEYAGNTAPNPPVGCVLLDVNGRLLAAAAHRKAGEPHAEAAAIALSRSNGSFGEIHTVVVTLEPCNHTGRTPPCASAVLETAARQVYIGVRDPNPHVGGGGAARLAAAGLDVTFIEQLPEPRSAALASAAARLVAPFSKRVRTGLPFVTVKQAIDRTGSMLPPPGRKTFTSDASLDFAHRLRRRADAILTGSGTVIADAPEFTVRRVPDFPDKRRQLVILDRRRRVVEDYLEAARARGFEVTLATSLHEALAQLGSAGALEVLVEAGPQLTAAILASPWWDEHVVIRQGPENGADTVLTRLRAEAPVHGKDIHVFGDH